MTLHRSQHAGAIEAGTSTVGGPMMTSNGARALALLRLAMGFVFAWAFVDKTLGLNYSTPSARAWVNGGSPTKGFLSSVEVGPFRTWFHSIAGDGWANWLFMLGLLGVGVALLAGVAVRLAAISGVLMLALMWFAEFPPARYTIAGKPSGSTNPFADSHFIYALALVVVAATYAGSTWGFGRMWARLPFVQRHRWVL